MQAVFPHAQSALTQNAGASRCWWVGTATDVGAAEKDYEATRDGLMHTRPHQVSIPVTVSRRHTPAPETRTAQGQDDRHRSSSRADATATLWQAWLDHRCTRAHEGLVTHYMKTHVQCIAERLRASLPAHIDVDDLVQQGYLGLVEAIERFDAERGIRFETFSSRRINGAMRDWLRAQDPAPRLMRQRARLVDDVTRRFKVAHGRIPDRQELREALGLEEAEFNRVVDEDRPPVLLTTNAVSPNGQDDEVTLPARSGQGPLVGLVRHDLRRWVVRDLEPIDRMIVTLYYYESLTMREVGVALGCSESRVSQRLESILCRLRARLDITPERLTQMAC